MNQHEIDYLRSMPESELDDECRLLLAKADNAELAARDDYYFGDHDD